MGKSTVPVNSEGFEAMSHEDFIKWQGTRTNAATAEILCCSLRLVEAMRQGTRPVSKRTQLMIERVGA